MHSPIIFIAHGKTEKSTQCPQNQGTGSLHVTGIILEGTATTVTDKCLSEGHTDYMVALA